MVRARDDVLRVPLLERGVLAGPIGVAPGERVQLLTQQGQLACLVPSRTAWRSSISAVRAPDTASARPV
ncbi:hypothetical protein [Streptomyces sp. NBC_01197]|uniref:hypothetical protein n=1 Tax=Streptomyces sp. NBC_01197 TaxID=2903768 RepID=UPI002E12906B|nr:hypothetical protein OG452_08910 [Streptomyces sp. NBC_01197]